jgi:ribosomal protein S18 acetylase RimI-like enzyme
MTLIPIETPEDYSLAEQFVIPHEETCASLASLVRRKTDKLVFLKDPSTSSGTTDSILGILNLDSTIYHCIPDTNLIDKIALLENLPYLLKKPVRCISGEAESTKYLINFFPNPAQLYDYKMMKFPVPSAATENEAISLSGGEEIIRCTEHDMELLHPLQKDYMKEEVAVPGRTLSDAEVDISLRQILKNQLCFALTVDGEIVAKANTNAIGINCVQIGGVYTHPLYRRNGYAGALVQALSNRAIRSGKHPVLFVKEKNTPAFNLYQKLGFEECGRYTIAYY